MEKADFKLSLWNWAVIFCKGKFGGGITSVLEYVLTIFNDKVLSKVSPEDLKKYSGIIVALAEFGQKVLDLYIVDEAKLNALTKTVETLRNLATALEDGEVTTEELELAINEVIETINVWKSIKTIKAKAHEKAEALECETFVPGEAAQ